MKKILLIDDIRNNVNLNITYGISATYIATSYSAGLEQLKAEQWDLLLLDHDLASYVDDVEKTGYDIMCWLEENPQYLPKDIWFVSANPVGVDKMLVVKNRLYENR